MCVCVCAAEIMKVVGIQLHVLAFAKAIARAINALANVLGTTSAVGRPLRFSHAVYI